jgi:hypothetical protein
MLGIIDEFNLIAYHEFSPIKTSSKPSSLAGTTIVSISENSIFVVVSSISFKNGSN